MRQKCSSDRCSYASECAYAKHIDAFKSGKYKFQIYSGAFYEKAWADGEIPLKSTIIGADVIAISCEQDTLNTGLRLGELLGLQWSEIHLGGAKPYIEIKRQLVREYKTSKRDPDSQIIRNGGKTSLVLKEVL